jgi:3-oxoacyl-[acyl-carrier-protein] synthase II
MARVVVTGVGLVTPLGVGTEETWQGIASGRSAVGPIESYDPSSLRTQLAAELNGFEPEQFATRKALRSMTRNDKLAVAGAALAVQDAALETPEEGDPARTRRGLFVGSNKEVSNLPPILEGALFAQTEDGSIDVGRLGENATSALPPLYYVEGLQAASLFYISQAYGLMGANTYYAGTADAGAAAVGSAFRAVRRGEVDVALAGSFDDATSWWNMTKYDTMGLLTDENELGAEACRPYDVDRRGAVLGEGSAFLVLEDEEHAASRGAKVYAEVAGFGGAYDVYGLLTPEPGGRPLATAIAAALRDAGASSADVSYVVTHGCGTRAGDTSEARALRTVFGDGRTPAASSIKPATGHLVGGAGALNAAAAVLALHHQTLPPTLNLETVDPACDGIDWVSGESRQAGPSVALAVARGLEGQNVALVVRSAP